MLLGVYLGEYDRSLFFNLSDIFFSVVLPVVLAIPWLLLIEKRLLTDLIR